MAHWYKTGGYGPYLRRSVRRGGKVHSEHLGGGLFAELTAILEQERMEERQAAQELERQERQAALTLDSSVDAALELGETLTAAILFAAGYHRHKRQWRRSRYD
jgi:hypothetical protein